MLRDVKDGFRIRRLRRRLRRLRRIASNTVEEHRSKGLSAADLNEISREAFFEVQLADEELSDLETQALVRRAASWDVAVPAYKEGQDWEITVFTQVWVLTDQGKMDLRRNIAKEIEIRHRPWQTWGAFIISVLSLALAVIALIFATMPPAA